MERKNLKKYLILFLIFMLQVGCSSTSASQVKNPPVSKENPAAGECPLFFGESQKVMALDHPPDIIGMTSADFNNDGLSDVLITRMFDDQTTSAPMVFLLNDGKGGFYDGDSELFDEAIPGTVLVREVVLADFNGDRRNDIFIADHGLDAPPEPGAENTLVLSTGSNTMEDSSGKWPDLVDYTHSAAAADIDGDGDIDLYVGNVWGATHEQPAIYLNADGNGTFVKTAGRLPYPLEDIDFGAFTTSEFVDVNNDNAPDLILGDAGDDLAGGRDSYVLLNDDSGNFSYLENAMPEKPWSESDSALDIKAADIDHDGYQDLLVLFTRAEYRGWAIQLLLNNGDGTFRDETTKRLSLPTKNEAWLAWVQFVDLDADGDLDIATIPSVGNKNSHFFLNDGEGFFTHIDNPFNFKAEFFTFVDVDQDGHVDVVWGQNYPSYSVYVSRSLGCATLGD
jgi:hypothetical protein